MPRSTSHSSSPIVPARKIKDTTRLLLFARAGGRCEFDGCNKFLLENHVTLSDGIFAQMAHIVAFKPEGPRGSSGARPVDINDISNLMLLCPESHKEIDDHPEKWTRPTLESFKAAHEERIRHVTGLGPDRKTAVLVLRAPIRGQLVSIPFVHLVEATAPRYPSRREPYAIDLTTISDDGPRFIAAATKTIKDRVSRFFEQGGEGYAASHVSVFALAPIPLLVFLGRQLTNKVPSDLYQRHRDREDWTWKERGPRLRYSFGRRRKGSRRAVALVLSLSGRVPLAALPRAVRERSTIYEISLKGKTPSPTFLKTRRDLEDFRLIYQEAVGKIIENHGLLPAIDLFPAVPAPIAVLCGRELLPKVHPKLRVYDYDKAKVGFQFALEV